MSDGPTRDALLIAEEYALGNSALPALIDELADKRVAQAVKRITDEVERRLREEMSRGHKHDSRVLIGILKFIEAGEGSS